MSVLLDALTFCDYIFYTFVTEKLLSFTLFPGKSSLQVTT